MLAFGAQLSLFYGLLWVIHQLLSYSSADLFDLVKFSLILSIFLLSLLLFFRGILGKPASGYVLKAIMSHVWNFSDHMYLSLFLRVYMCLSDIPSLRLGDPGDAIILIM